MRVSPCPTEGIDPSCGAGSHLGRGRLPAAHSLEQDDQQDDDDDEGANPDVHVGAVTPAVGKARPPRLAVALPPVLAGPRRVAPDPLTVAVRSLRGDALDRVGEVEDRDVRARPAASPPWSVSAPRPPRSLSRLKRSPASLTSPVSESFPIPPNTRSLPAQPCSVSSPSPPASRSRPASPLAESLLAPPRIRSSPGPPAASSFPGPMNVRSSPAPSSTP